MKKPMMQILTAIILFLIVLALMYCEIDSSTNDGNGDNTAQLTMVSNPPEGGITNPTAGQHAVATGAAQTITATANEGYVFAEWTATENATIADSSSDTTSVTISGDAEVTANFEQIITTAQLTISVNPPESGTTNPTIGIHTVTIDSIINIMATPAEGYIFSYWSATENATIVDSSAENTTVTLTGDAEITANFNLDPNPSELVGLWNAISAMVTFVITTNSNQTAVDIISPCNGTITVTGSENATLSYMAQIEIKGVPTIIATDVPLLELMEGTEGFFKPTTVQGNRVSLPILKADLGYPYHGILHTDALDIFMVVTGPGDTTFYIGSGVEYDSDNYTLSANNVNLPLLGFIPPGVTLNGTMQNITTNVPANTPTPVMTMPMPDESSWILDVEANGTFTGYMDEFLIIDADTTYGTWEVTTDNNLMIIDTLETDTLYATYEFSGNDLILTVDQEICDEDKEDYEDCLNGIGELVGVDEGSLIDAIIRVGATFVKL
jgi:hypothetical protein